MPERVLDAWETDKKLLDWLEANADEIEFIRDLSAGTSVRLHYCSKVSSCQVSQQAKTIREAGHIAMLREEERAKL